MGEVLITSLPEENIATVLTSTSYNKWKHWSVQFTSHELLCRWGESKPYAAIVKLKDVTHVLNKDTNAYEPVILDT